MRAESQLKWRGGGGGEELSDELQKYCGAERTLPKRVNYGVRKNTD